MNLFAIGGLGLGACGGVTDGSQLPPDVKDPAALHTPSGALARYRGALAALPPAFDGFLTVTGILTDELASLPAPLNVGRSPYTAIDSRQDLTAGFENVYAALHRVRGQAREARGFLTAYAPDSSPALAGHLYAVEGYAEVWLAELFCSGIPLSTVNFNGDYTLAAGSSTADVYRHALELFDSAFAMTTDSVPFQHLAAVGKGRILLALGRYAEAAAAVAAVPDNYQHQVTLPTGSLLQSFANGTTEHYAALPATPSMGDSEGGHGFDYRTSNDPRTLATAQPGTDPFGNMMYFPNKYPVTGTIMYTVADGIEARLIEAEAALQTNAVNGQWLILLNHLRQTAITPALDHLTDPGQDANGRDGPRVNLLFRERAFWLYLAGHRQGDLRRLVRRYLRMPSSVYPTGLYPGGRGSYGDAVVAPVPASEQQGNQQYTGCLDTNA